MNAYQDTLTRFQRYVLDEDQSMEDHVVGADITFRQTRLNVYHDGYALRLIEIMEKCFTSLHTLMGEALFDKTCRDYIAAHPSRHFSVGLIGRHFSQFLATHFPAEPIYAELALFEWHLGEVLEAADGPHVTFEEMAAALAPEDWATLALTPHPSITTATFHYPTPQFWQHLIHETDKPELTRHEMPTRWLIWRFNMRARFCPITPDQTMLFNLLTAGQTFNEICEQFAVNMPEDDIINFMSSTIRQWVAEGIFSGFTVHNEPE